ncbi:MAG: exodeoxyribonuclease VII small subunit [Coriobacteriales bacterium]
MAEQTEPTSFAEVNSRLEQIAEQVKDKDLSLEKSLDLYEEAVRLSSVAVSLVQKPDLSADEEALLETMKADRLAQSRDASDLGDRPSGQDASDPAVTEQTADVDESESGSSVSEAGGPNGG